MAFKMNGYSAYDKRDTTFKKDGLPEGFYDAYSNADKTNVSGASLNEQATKVASVKAGKFVAVYR